MTPDFSAAVTDPLGWLAEFGVEPNRLRRLLGVPSTTWDRWRRRPPRQRQLLAWATIGVYLSRFAGLEPEQIAQALENSPDP